MDRQKLIQIGEQLRSLGHDRRALIASQLQDGAP